MKVKAEAVLKEIEGRRLVFQIKVYDEVEKVSEGLNERHIVSREYFKRNLKKSRMHGRKIKKHPD